MSHTVSLVTGANRGLGWEVARQLGELGHLVVVGCRRPEAGREALDRLRQTGMMAELVVLDVRDATSVATAAADIERSHQRLDVLVNNAGTGYAADERAVTADLVDVRATLETNLFGSWSVIQAVLPLLRRSAHPRIVNVSSRAGSLRRMEGGAPSYRVSKVALNALTRMLADELRDDGILVNSVCPGRSATAMVGYDGRPLADGASGIVWAATLEDTGPTGGFFRDREPVDW